MVPLQAHCLPLVHSRTQIPPLPHRPSQGMMSAVRSGAQWREVMRVHSSGSALSDGVDDCEMADVEEEQEHSMAEQLASGPAAVMPGDVTPETLEDAAAGAGAMARPDAAGNQQGWRLGVDGVDGRVGKLAMPVMGMPGAGTGPRLADWSAPLSGHHSTAYPGLLRERGGSTRLVLVVNFGLSATCVARARHAHTMRMII